MLNKKRKFHCTIAKKGNNKILKRGIRVSSMMFGVGSLSLTTILLGFLLGFVVTHGPGSKH